MKNEDQNAVKEEHLARASVKDLSISTKHCIEICRCLRYKTTAQAKKILEELISFEKPIPFKRFKRDIGHKPGMAAGRYPQKAAKEVLKLIRSAESNAQFKGLNISSLKIIKLLANKASVPITGGRHRTGTKRTHLEIEVKETKEKKKEKTADKKATGKKEEIKKEAKNKKETSKPKKETKPEEKPTEEKAVEQKEKKEEPKKEEVKEEKKETEKPQVQESKEEKPKENKEIKPEGEQAK